MTLRHYRGLCVNATTFRLKGYSGCMHKEYEREVFPENAILRGQWKEQAA